MQVSLSVGAACALGAPWLQLISVALFIVVGALFLRNPGESLLTLTLLLIVFFLIEGISKVIFAADDTAVPELGLGPG